MRLGKEGWADEISGISKDVPTRGQFGPVRFGDVEIGSDLGEMLLADQRADFSCWIQRVADLDIIDPFNQPSFKSILNGLMDQKP